MDRRGCARGASRRGCGCDGQDERLIAEAMRFDLEVRRLLELRTIECQRDRGPLGVREQPLEIIPTPRDADVALQTLLRPAHLEEQLRTLLRGERRLEFRARNCRCD